jgi:hypothetical protein
VGVLFSCATGGGREAPPDWVLAPPLSDDQYELFYASASDPSGDVAAAEEAAGYSILAQVNQALGVDITVETSATAQASLESYEADLVQTVTQSGTGRITGFRIADRYVQESEAVGVTVHVLAQYEKGAFAEEQARRERIRREAIELFAGPERDGESSESSGDYLVAVEKYVQSAVAAAQSSLEEAPSVLQRTLQRAGRIMSSLALEPVSAPTQASLGSAPDEPFVARLVVVEGSRRTPVSGVPIDVAYETSGRTGRTTIRHERVLTDADGLAAFVHPDTDAAGQMSVSMRLEVDQINQLLSGIPREHNQLVSAIRDGMADQLARFRFNVVSRAREVPTIIAIIDVDSDGVVFSEQRGANSVVQSLSQNGFNVRMLGVDSATLDATRGPALLSLIRDETDGAVERAIYGSVVVVESSETSDGGYLAKVSAEVTAVELESGAVLYSASVIKSARGSSESRAISSAMSQAGELLGQELASNLP